MDKNKVDNIYKLLIFFTLTVLVLTAFITGSFSRVSYWYNLNLMTQYFSLPLFLYTIMICIHLPYRSVLCFMNQPYVQRNGYYPKVTVIIPAYNEGKMVEKSICSCLNSNYPKSRLQIISVDDGSEDDTWHYIRRQQKEHPDLVKGIRLPQNRGKRWALAEGFKRASGKILVTMDSDSVMERDALSNLVAPFIDKEIGAATAKVKVLNKNENLLTRMIGVRYIMAFEFYRASRSTFKTVFCCSGVLSAYRKEIIDKIMDQWLHQRFMGQVCTYGDDRSLTNFILRSGYYTVYQRNSVVYTLVPSTLPKLARMLVRWHKSFIRESIVFITFMFSNYRRNNRFLPIFDFTLSTVLIPFQFYIIIYSIIHIFIDPLLILRFLAIITIMGSVYMSFYVKFEKNTDFVFGLLYSFLHVFFLMWTVPYAVITFKNNSWLTR
ncbi:MAG: glycosyltransferase family 2 protein [Candidatus Aminicenantes bacterium]|nr:glycosyltransferase family 2 protein [Candidatus Aminicenantes bacterium]MDH5714766.1 glycosyltransferase family 2 protein [Candidatus Aminicenantes bacterium]